MKNTVKPRFERGGRQRRRTAATSAARRFLPKRPAGHRVRSRSESIRPASEPLPDRPACYRPLSRTPRLRGGRHRPPARAATARATVAPPALRAAATRPGPLGRGPPAGFRSADVSATHGRQEAARLDQQPPRPSAAPRQLPGAAEHDGDSGDARQVPTHLVRRPPECAERPDAERSQRADRPGHDGVVTIWPAETFSITTSASGVPSSSVIIEMAGLGRSVADGERHLECQLGSPSEGPAE